MIRSFLWYENLHMLILHTLSTFLGTFILGTILGYYSSKSVQFCDIWDNLEYVWPHIQFYQLFSVFTIISINTTVLRCVYLTRVVFSVIISSNFNVWNLKELFINQSWIKLTHARRSVA